MLVGLGILAAALVAGLWAVLVRHAGWSRLSASLAAFALCPLVVLAYGYSIDDPMKGGLVLMFGLPIAVLVGFAGVGLVLLGDALLTAGGAIDPDGDES